MDSPYIIATVLIFVILVALMTAILVFMLIRGHRLKKKMVGEIFANAIPGQATVLNLARGSYTSGEGFRNLELKITFQVHQPAAAPYETTMKWVVDELALPQIQPNQVVPVKINRKHPERVYPDVEWAEFSDWTLKELK